MPNLPTQFTTSGITTPAMVGGVPAPIKLSPSTTQQTQQIKTSGGSMVPSMPVSTPTTVSSTQTSSLSSLSGLLSSLSSVLSGLMKSLGEFSKGGSGYVSTAVSTIGGSSLFGGQTTKPSVSPGGVPTGSLPIKVPTSTVSAIEDFLKKDTGLFSTKLFSIRTSETTPAMILDNKMLTSTGLPVPYGAGRQQVPGQQQVTTKTTETETKPSVTIPIETKDGSIPVDFSLTDEGINLILQSFGEQQAGFTPTGFPAGGGEVFVYRDPLGGATPIMGHIIQSGETLSKIAQKYGSSVEELLRLNRENKEAIKSPDLIIAGKQIFVPVKKQPVDIQRELQTGLPVNVQDINTKIQNIYEKIKSGDIADIKITPELAQGIMFKMMGDELRELDLRKRNLDLYDDPNFYQRKYQDFVNQSGLSDVYSRYFDLNKILNQTRDDVMKEAIASGGIVTQSQIEEIVGWRTSLIKGEMQALSDLIEMKERTIDKMMKFVEADRNYLSKLFDDQLAISDRKRKLITESFKWYFDWTNDMVKYNRTKLTTALNSGALAQYSDNLLLEMADPDSPLYTGYTIEELVNLKNIAELITKKRQAEINNTLERLRLAKEKPLLQKGQKKDTDFDIMELLE